MRLRNIFSLLAFLVLLPISVFGQTKGPYWSDDLNSSTSVGEFKVCSRNPEHGLKPQIVELYTITADDAREFVRLGIDTTKFSITVSPAWSSYEQGDTVTITVTQLNQTAEYGIVVGVEDSSGHMRSRLMIFDGREYNNAQPAEQKSVYAPETSKKGIGVQQTGTSIQFSYEPSYNDRTLALYSATTGQELERVAVYRNTDRITLNQPIINGAYVARLETSSVKFVVVK